MLRRIALLGGLVAVLLTAWATPALAKSFHIAAARVEVEILSDGSLLGLLRSLVRVLELGLAGLLGLITGSRRENGGTRRDERQR